MSTRFNATVATMIAVVMSIGCAAVSYAAAPLADQLPDDAIIYIGWAGGSKLGPAYQQSHTKALIDASDLAALMRELWPSIQQKIAADDPQAAEQADALTKVIEQALQYPTTFYFGGFDQQSPLPRLALICDTGDSAEAQRLQQIAAPLIQQLQEEHAPIQLTIDGGRVMLAPFGFAAQLTTKSAAPLADNATFTAAMAQLNIGEQSSALVAYADVQKFIAMVSAMVRGPDADQWQQVKQALALDDIQRAIFVGGFEHGDWVTRAWMQMQVGRGVTKLFDAQPMDESTIRAIPQSAAIAGGARCDLAVLYDTIHDLVSQLDPRAGRRFDHNVADLNRMLGVNLRDDLLATLGDQWVWYTDRNVGGTGLPGIVVVNSLRDADKFQQTLPRLVNIANGMLAMAMRRRDMTIAIRTTQVDGVTLYYLATPAVAPTFAVKDGRLYAGLQPQTVAAAMQGPADGKSILDNPTFTKLHQQAGGKPINAFAFYDLPQTFSTGYQTMLLLARVYLGIGDMAGFQTPPLLLPTHGQLAPHIAPAAAFVWSDEQGIHKHTVTPFPGATLICTEQNVMVAQQALALGIMLPALGRARTIANRSVSAANLSGIYKACYIYSVSHNDQFPNDLSVLIADGSIGIKSVLHPEDASRAQSFPQVRLDDPKVSQWVKENTSYVYLGGDANIAADGIVAYEKPDGSWAREGINIVFGDGHVAWTSWAGVPEVFKQAGLTPPAPPAGAASRKDKSVHGSGQSWYYDTTTGDYFLAAADQFPPITSPKGNPAVRAHFFSCGNCANESERFVGFYDKFTDDAKKKLQEARDNPNANMDGMEMYYDNGVLYSVDGKTWFPPSDVTYQEALSKKLRCPNGAHAKYCLPGR